jgi:hypothetical protein
MTLRKLTFAVFTILSLATALSAIFISPVAAPTCSSCREADFDDE